MCQIHKFHPKTTAKRSAVDQRVNDLERRVVINRRGYQIKTLWRTVTRPFVNVRDGIFDWMAENPIISLAMLTSGYILFAYALILSNP